MMKILSVIGTRPEAIKMAPVILELDKHPDAFTNLVCVTAQHRQMLDQVLNWFGIKADYDLNLMRENQTLEELTGRILLGLSALFKTVKPDIVLVQGDTTTVMVGALAAFYQHIPVGHVEAGLRTAHRYNPFPEEINRRITGILAAHHFAPTRSAADALKTENVPEKDIHITGNTVIDALLWTLGKKIDARWEFLNTGNRMILVTAHRRENFGPSFESICMALRDIAERNTDVEIVYPVHLNPNIRKPAHRLLSGHPRIHLMEPLQYELFSHLLERSYLILTDSGGIQEEAPALGKPVLVMRETTERPEAIEAGTAILVGTGRKRIVTETEKLLHDDTAYQSMAHKANPFGDGHASEKIVNILKSIIR